MNEEPEFDTETGESTKSRHLVLKLTVALVTILGLWALAAGWLLIRPKETRPRPIPTETWREPPKGEEAIAQAMEAWRAFLEAHSLESRIQQVRDPDRVGPMMRDYHETRSKPYPTMGLSSAGQVVSLENQQMVVFEIEGFDGLIYPVALSWTGQRFAVDWESLTAYGTMDWGKMIETRPTAPQVMRVYLGSLPSELKPPAALSQARQFIRMDHRDSPDSAILALKPELAPEVLRLIEGKRVPVTIELSWNDAIQSFELHRFLGEGWSRQH